MSRPSEPNTDQENPEQWAVIAEGEKDRADRLSYKLDALINAADDASSMLSQAVREVSRA